MKTETLYNLNDFNDWFADYLAMNEMRAVLEPSPLRYHCEVHWEHEDPGTEFTYYKLYYHFTYSL
jgi:hypothetical protein